MDFRVKESILILGKLVDPQWNIIIFLPPDMIIDCVAAYDKVAKTLEAMPGR